jgi:hypothetical protein
MEAIEQTYFDTCTISRMGNVVQTNGSLKQQRVPVYTNIKCALSIGSRPAVNTITDKMYNRDDVLNQIHSQDKLFLNPSYIVQQGDEVVVSRNGRTITAQLGNPFVYDSHQQVTLDNVRFA